MLQQSPQMLGGLAGHTVESVPALDVRDILLRKAPFAHIDRVALIIIGRRHLRKAVTREEIEALIFVAAIPVDDRDVFWDLVPHATKVAIDRIEVIDSIMQ